MLLNVLMWWRSGMSAESIGGRLGLTVPYTVLLLEAAGRIHAEKAEAAKVARKEYNDELWRLVGGKSRAIDRTRYWRKQIELARERASTQ